jgi:hypothetical protein
MASLFFLINFFFVLTFFGRYIYILVGIQVANVAPNYGASRWRTPWTGFSIWVMHPLVTSPLTPCLPIHTQVVATAELPPDDIRAGAATEPPPMLNTLFDLVEKLTIVSAFLTVWIIINNNNNNNNK